MDSTELMRAFDSEVGRISQMIISEAEKYRYLDTAYRLFARLTGGIPDTASVAVETGERSVALPVTTLKIARASRASDGAKVDVINHTDLDRLHLRDDQEGPVRYLLVGVQMHKGTLYDIPVEDDTLNLVIQRLPLTHITQAGQALSEIDEDHHLALLDWMKSLAYKRPGADFFNPTLSAAFATSFTAYCQQAKSEITTMRHKVRSTTYGGY
jgi:hypothetical protein